MFLDDIFTVLTILWSKGFVAVAHLSFEFKRFMHLLPVSFSRKTMLTRKRQQCQNLL